MTEIKNLCPGCFTDNHQVKPCLNCSYDERDPRGPLVLPHHTVLQGQFIIGKVLGKPGGFGTAYLGWDLRLEMLVAIKEYLPRDLAGRESGNTTVIPHSRNEENLFRYGLEQFLTEAKILVKLNHPNIVRVRHSFEANKTAYLVMDYYAGLSLDEYLERKGGRISEQTAIQLILPILDGLREVHSRGFLHRDIKPQNIYLARLESGGVRPILLDFGAARQAMGERSRSLSVLLTAGYAPYEQYYSGGHQGTWSDVYAVGATLYQMVTGVVPPDAAARRDQDELQPATAYGVSSALSTILIGTLSVLPEQRTQTVNLFQEQLLKLGEHSSTGNEGNNSSHNKQHKNVSSIKLPHLTQQIWIGVVLLTILSIGLAFGGWYLYQQTEKTRDQQNQELIVQIRKSEILLKEINDAIAKLKQRRDEEKKQQDAELEKNKQANEQACSTMYSVFKKCYEAGVGKDVNMCANLSSEIMTQMQDQMGPIAAAVGLLCGLACNEGVERKDLPDYSSFKTNHCQDLQDTNAEPHAQQSPTEAKPTETPLPQTTQPQPPNSITAIAPTPTIGDNYVYSDVYQWRPEANRTISKTVDDFDGKVITLSTLDLNKPNTQKQTLFFDGEWNLISDDSNAVEYSPPLKYYDFPLYPGKTWQQNVTETNTKTSTTKTAAISGVVGSWEDITVPAGTFHAIKINLAIEIFNIGSDVKKKSTYVLWYVPEVRRVVKTVVTNEDGKVEEISLVSYKLSS